MLYREPKRFRPAHLWLRLLVRLRQRRALQDVRRLSDYLRRDIGLAD